MKINKETIERLLTANTQKALVIDKIVQYLMLSKSVDRDNLLQLIEVWKNKHIK